MFRGIFSNYSSDYDDQNLSAADALARQLGRAQDPDDFWTFDIHAKLLLFKEHSLEGDVWTYQGPNTSQQRCLQTIAHKLGLEYEYSLNDRTVRISTPLLPLNWIPYQIPSVTDTVDMTVLSGGRETFLETPTQQLHPFGSTLNPTPLPLITQSHAFAEFSSDLPCYFPTDPPQFPTYEAGQENYHGPLDNHQDATLFSEPLYSTSNAPSRPSSVMSRRSVQSTQSRGRSRRASKTSRRHSSAHSKASSGYGEIVFSAHPSRSSSTASNSRRHGPLDSAKKAAMNALKKVGACWRCRILKKTCHPETPCSTCPNPKRGSAWGNVGCRRGGIADEMSRTSLCPKLNKELGLSGRLQSSNEDSPIGGLEIDDCNPEFRKFIKNDETRMWRSKPYPNIDTNLAQLIDSNASISLKLWPYDDVFDHRPIEDFSPGVCDPFPPLPDDVLRIERALRSNDAKTYFTGLHDPTFPYFRGLIKLIRAAATYQAEIETNNLVLHAIACLRGSLDTFRAHMSHIIGPKSHRNCSISCGCKVECVADLDQQLNSYLRELTRVFFPNKTGKHKQEYHDSWLSLFYSLCIQGLVRRLLCKITGRRNSFPNQYLYLGERLFIAKFGKSEPFKLGRKAPQISQFSKKDMRHHLDAAHLVVENCVRGSKFKGSCYTFLQWLFEDSEEITL